MKRKNWITLHRWLALALGGHWFLLAITGCILVFHREIETAWMGAEPAAIGVPDVDAAITAVESATGRAARLVVIEDRPIRALRVFSENKIDTVLTGSSHIASSTGIDGGLSPTGIIRFIYVLHYQLSAGHIGEWLVTASAVFLFVTIVAGLKLGWPRPGTWLRTLKPRLAGKTWQRHYAVHRSTGLLVSLGLISAVITGLAMIWGDSINALANGDAKAASPPPPIISTKHPPSANKAIAIAMSALPDSEFVRIDLPTKERPSFRVRLREENEFRPVFGASNVEVAAVDGRILAVEPASAASVGQKTVIMMLPLHNGSWLGIGGRLLVLLQGLALIYLAASGLILWVARR